MNRRTRRAHGAHVSAPEEIAPPVAVPEPEPPLPEREPAEPGVWIGRAVSLFKAVLGVAIVAGAASGLAWGAHHYALTSPRFAIAELATEGATRLGVEQIRRQAGIARGQNIFAVDLDNAERRLLENPWIEQVRVSRELPRTLRIELEEREAAALAVIGEQLYLLDRSGSPFKRLEADERFELPLVTGISPENLARDRKRELLRIAGALEVLRIYERIPLSKSYPAQELHLYESGEVVLSVGKNGTALHLGTGPFRKKLLMAERVMNRLGSKGRSAGLVFLDNEAHPERVVVRMR